MKKMMAAFLSAAACLLAFDGKNILNETDFPGDSEFFPGTLGIWNVDPRDNEHKPIVVLKGEGPDGANAVRLNIQFGGAFRQQNAWLVAGEPYRFGAYFRTKDYKTETVTVRIWNHGWTKEIKTQEIPRDTNGQWVKIEATGTMPSSPDGIYTYGVYSRPQSSGQLDIAMPYLIPLSEKAQAESRIAGNVIKTPTRIIPVYPLLKKIDVANPAMRFFIPNKLEGGANSYEVRVQVQMDGDIPTPWGIYDLSESRLVDANLGKLPLGNGMLRVRLLKRGRTTPTAQNEYAIKVIKVPPKANLKKLNNMVGEILDAPLKNGNTAFENPREGWVFIGFDKPYPDAKAYLDGAAAPVVKFRQDEPSDTMRLLTFGRHTIRIEGAPEGGRLLVRAVPHIMLYPILARPENDFNNFCYDMPFYRKHLLHSINFFDTESWIPQSEYYKNIDAELAERGKRIVGSRSLWRNENIDEIDKMVKGIRENKSLLRNWGLTLDELSLTANPGTTLATTEALWRLTELDKRVFLWCCGVGSGTFSNPFVHHELLSAGANVSQSEGKMFMETYVGTRRTEEEALQSLEYLPKHLEVASKLTPDAAERLMMIMSGYTTPECFCVNIYPEADIKVLFDMFFNMLANDKRLNGLHGTGFYSFAHTDQEIVRWVGRLMRHYCVEGKTESLAKKYGFKYNPGHLKDGDFEDGFKYWTVNAAEEGSIQHKTVNGYGGSAQCRIDRPKNLGDTVALFTRSAKSPNKLSQNAVGLTPGKLYCLSFMTVDYDDFLKPRNKHIPFTFEATIEDADIIPEASSHRIFPPQWNQGIPAQKPGTTEKDIRRIVFRAKKDTARITFSDWKSATEPGGAPGERRLLNWISVNPYFEK